MKTIAGYMVLTVAFVAGCAGSMTREQSWAQAQGAMIDSIAKRVTFETGCPVEQIRATYLDPKTVGVEVCGQRMIYVIVPSHGTPPCADPFDSSTAKPHTWYMKWCQPLLNSASEETGATGSTMTPVGQPAADLE